MKFLRRCKSAPNRISEMFVDETINQMKKSVSTQFLTEMTQLTVDDLKTTTEFISNLGSNVNELAQSGVDYFEQDSNSSKVSFTTLLVQISSRLFIGMIVHQIHDFIVFVFHFISHYVPHMS